MIFFLSTYNWYLYTDYFNQNRLFLQNTFKSTWNMSRRLFLKQHLSRHVSCQISKLMSLMILVTITLYVVVWISICGYILFIIFLDVVYFYFFNSIKNNSFSRSPFSQYVLSHDCCNGLAIISWPNFLCSKFNYNWENDRINIILWCTRPELGKAKS